MPGVEPGSPVYETESEPTHRQVENHNVNGTGRGQGRTRTGTSPRGTALQAAGPARDHTKAIGSRAPGRNRTAGPRVRNPVLYPLSYEGMTCV